MSKTWFRPRLVARIYITILRKPSIVWLAWPLGNFIVYTLEIQIQNLLSFISQPMMFMLQCYICFTIYLVIEYNKIFYNQVVVLLHFMRRQLLYEKITISVVGKCVFLRVCSCCSPLMSQKSPKIYVLKNEHHPKPVRIIVIMENQVKSEVMRHTSIIFDINQI